MTTTLTLRPARAEDDARIKDMVRRARLDPTKLDWRFFLVAESDGEIISIGQVRHHPDGARELGSLVTRRAHQGRGVAGQIIAALEAKYGLPMSLFCLVKLETFYNRFGYQRVTDARQLPVSLRRKYRLARLLRLIGFTVIVMRKA